MTDDTPTLPQKADTVPDSYKAYQARQQQQQAQSGTASQGPRSQDRHPGLRPEERSDRRPDGRMEAPVANAVRP